jgi:hypothetical protein
LGQTVTGGGAETPYVLGGNWNINVQGGNVTDFAANFAMVHQDGTGYHIHNITDFSAGNKTVQMIQGQETTINGTADYVVNGTTKWPGVDTVLTFTNNGAVMTINPAAEDTDNHFGGQPIYGIVIRPQVRMAPRLHKQHHHNNRHKKNKVAKKVAVAH